MDTDDVVTDGAHCPRKVQFPQGPFTSLKDGLSKDYGSKGSSKCDIDSGFLSGLSITEDSSTIFSSSSLSAAEDTESMKINSAVLYSDSGVDLEYPNKFRNNLGSSISLESEQQNKPSYTNNLDSATKQPLETPRLKVTLQDLVRQDEDGDTILHHAIIQGFIEVVFSLVRILPDALFLEIPNNNFQTPLHLAVLTGQAPLVRRLVVGGASVLLRDRNGNTPLHLACRDGHLECARALLEPVSIEERRSALLPLHVSLQPLPQDLEQKNYEGQAALHLAAMNGHIHVVQLLRCFGANVNAVEGKYGRTPLHYAVERRNPNLLHFLVSQCQAMTEAKTYSGYTPYEIATVAAPVLAALLAKLGAQVRPMPLEIFSSSDDDYSSSDAEVSPQVPRRAPKDSNLAVMTEMLHIVA